jgi:release factor glutamine methyltransferase
LNFEPRKALTDNCDGLENYRIIANNAKKFLKKDGLVVLEIGFNQSKKIKEMFCAKGCEVEIFKDLQSIDRIVIIKDNL